MATISTPGKKTDTNLTAANLSKAAVDIPVRKLNDGLFRYIPDRGASPTNRTDNDYRAYWG